jgi:hypothetical protein
MDQPPHPEGPQWGLGTQTIMYAPNPGFQVPIGSQATQLGNSPQGEKRTLPKFCPKGLCTDDEKPVYLHGDGRPPAHPLGNFGPRPGHI